MPHTRTDRPVLRLSVPSTLPTLHSLLSSQNKPRQTPDKETNRYKTPSGLSKMPNLNFPTKLFPQILTSASTQPLASTGVKQEESEDEHKVIIRNKIIVRLYLSMMLPGVA